jgi:hypothetical protein
MGRRENAATWAPVSASGPSDVSIDREGRFELRGWAGTDELRVAASAQGLCKATREFRAGDAAVDLALASTGALRGTLLLDARCGQGAVEIVAVSGLKVVQAERAPDGSFRIAGLEPGRYDLRVRSSVLQEVLAAVDGIEVRSGEETLDPRAAALDLRGKLMCLEIRIAMPAGFDDPLPLVEVRAPGAEPRLCYASTGRPFALATLAPAVDVLIQAPGWRLERLASVATDQAVALRPGLPVRLALQDGLPALPEGYELRALLEPLKFELRHRANSGVPFDARGTALLRASDPGPHRPRLEVLRRASDEEYTLPPALISPARLEIRDAEAEQTHSLKLDAPGLASLIERIERQH